MHVNYSSVKSYDFLKWTAVFTSEIYKMTETKYADLFKTTNAMLKATIW